MKRAALIDGTWILLGIVPTLALILTLIDAAHGLALTSIGSAAILTFCYPEHDGSRPLPMLAAHLLGAVIGLALLHTWGSDAWSMGAGVALLAAAMKIGRFMHPPAGANPLIVLNIKAGWFFLLDPLLYALAILMICLWVWSRARPGGPRWPLRWV